MKRKTIILSSIAVVVIAAVAVIFTFNFKDESIVWKTTEVKRGDISIYVTATGTLEAITNVEVGTQVSGTIKHIYVDFNSQVKKGQLIAELDKIYLNASVKEAESSVYRAQVIYNQSKREFERSKKLFEEKVLSESDYDLALSDYETKKSDLQSAENQLYRSNINLSYASIKAPIDGVVISRNVDEGQTVASSFNTPTLFTIAEDLTKMQVEASIDEADIGQVKEGQDVEFTVDAYPDEVFEGTVIQKRLEPTVSNNVVTYTVIIDAPNKDLKLMPGLTASISITVDKRSAVLILPNQALNYIPSKRTMDIFMKSNKLNHPDRPESTGDNLSTKLMSVKNIRKELKNENIGNVWINEGDNIRHQLVQIGLSDGVNTEIVDGLSSGTMIIIGVEKEKTANIEDASATSNNPFLPPKPPERR